MVVRVQEAVFDPWKELAEFGSGVGGATVGRYGATSVFVGNLRDFNQGQEVAGMTLEHYPGMTESYLLKISLEARTRWDLLELLVIHRYGAIQLGEPIVLVAVWSAHRDAAFAACRYLIDELKTRAPFWKQEVTAEGRRWVQPG